MVFIFILAAFYPTTKGKEKKEVSITFFRKEHLALSELEMSNEKLTIGKGVKGTLSPTRGEKEQGPTTSAVNLQLTAVSASLRVLYVPRKL